MPTFQPSKYSPKSNPGVFLNVEVADPQGGLFKVEWGKITYLGKGPSNYPAVNTVWEKSTDPQTYKEMIGNLSTASSANKDKIGSVLDPVEVKAAEAAAHQAAALVPAVSAGDSALPAGGDPGGKVPLTKHPLFWPAVIFGVAGVVGVGIWYTQKGSGDEMGAGDAVPA